MIPLADLAAELNPPEATDSTAYILENPSYKLCFSDKYGQAIWSFYKLTPKMMEGVFSTSEEYKIDGRIKNNRITPKEIDSTNLTKVQLYPLTHAAFDTSAQKSVFLTTNLMLMSKQLEESIWEKLNIEIENLVRQQKEVYVISGPIFDKDNLKLKYIINGKVAIPAFFYRIVLYYQDDVPVYKCWKFSNRIPTDYERTCSIDNFGYNLYQLEAETGIDFFDASVDNYFRKDKMKYLQDHVK